jgi:hypothetical protein
MQVQSAHNQMITSTGVSKSNHDKYKMSHPHANILGKRHGTFRNKDAVDLIHF